MKIWNRKLKKYEEESEPQQKLLSILYETIGGRFLLWAVFARPFFSKLNGIYQSSTYSEKKIPPFIKKYNVDMTEFEKDSYLSFNDFFIRKKNYEIESEAKELIASAEGKLSVYPISQSLELNIKNANYTVSELLGSKNLGAEFIGGICLVFRLSLTDYHRYIWIDDGKILKKKSIKGVLHTVRPIASHKRVYAHNSRKYCILRTKHFKDVMCMEVGAMLVGKIKNHNNGVYVKKLQEKGYFEYGGSTVIQMFKKDAVKIDEDIIKMNDNGIEVQVKIGEVIGRC